MRDGKQAKRTVGVGKLEGLMQVDSVLGGSTVVFWWCCFLVGVVKPLVLSPIGFMTILAPDSAPEWQHHY